MTHDEDQLREIAAHLYPGNVYLQQQWLRGVQLVRTTARGWLLDPPPLRVTPALIEKLKRAGRS